MLNGRTFDDTFLRGTLGLERRGLEIEGWRQLDLKEEKFLKRRSDFEEKPLQKGIPSQRKSYKWTILFIQIKAPLR